MNRIQTFQQFLATQSTQISIWAFSLNLFLAAILAFILSRVYIRYGYSLSNRRLFAKNFMLITVTTMFIITIVKSSLALSLGLVGALSIVRFRAAIKEPEELAYLFFAISIGLGFGAGQTIITIVAFIFIVSFIYIKGLSRKVQDQHNFYLTISGGAPEGLNLDQIVKVLKKFCQTVALRRFDETKEILEAVFLVEYENLGQFIECKEQLHKLSSSLRITFLDNKGVY